MQNFYVLMTYLLISKEYSNAPLSLHSNSKMNWIQRLKVVRYEFFKFRQGVGRQYPVTAPLSDAATNQELF